MEIEEKGQWLFKMCNNAPWWNSENIMIEKPSLYGELEWLQTYNFLYWKGALYVWNYGTQKVTMGLSTYS